jgi:restriction system protein
LWLSARRDHYRVARLRRRDRKQAAASMADIDAMAGVEFEEFVAAQLRTTGWSVTPTPASGDYGVDLIAQKGGTRMAVQCKRLTKAVGVAAVQQVVSGSLHHRCNRAVVVTNRTFTRAAQQLAATHRCRLVGREQIHVWVRVAAADGSAGPRLRRRLQPGLEA